MSTHIVRSNSDSDRPPHADSASIPSPPRQRVDHTYQDYSLFIEEGGWLPKQKKSGANFPANLQRILSDENYSHIITWMPHGRAWKILDKELLLSAVIPVYFGQKRFESFTRQLSNWGFRRLHQMGPDFGCYYHPCFLRGLPKLTALMRREARKKLTPHAEGEPDFYLISILHPLPPLPMPSDQYSRSRAPVASQPAVIVATMASTSNPIQEGNPGNSNENHTMLIPHPQLCSSAVTKPALSSQPSYQIRNDAHCTSTSTSTCTHGIPTGPGGDEESLLMQAQPITLRFSSAKQGEDHIVSNADGMDFDLFDGDYLRLLNLLVKSS